MIVLEDYGLAFVHIPKCGGTTVRTQLAKAGGELWSLGAGHVELEGGLVVDTAHLSLETLQCYWPEHFAELMRCRSFAIFRDPRERFASSLYQYLRQRLGRNVSEMRESEVRSEAVAVIEALRGHTGQQLDLNLAHFQKQVDFINLAGDRVISEVWLIDNLGEMMLEMNDHLVRGGFRGQALASARIGESRVSRFGVADTLKRVVSARVLDSVYGLTPEYVRQLWRRVAYRSWQSGSWQVAKWPEVIDFVRDYYSEDIEVFADLAGSNGRQQLSVDGTYTS